MSEQASVNVRALFSELGISRIGTEAAGVLVIDRFEQWSNPAGEWAGLCTGTATYTEDAWSDAA
jgi:hypothetical protein